MISPDEAPDRMKERFAEIDTDGNGFLDADEIRAMAESEGISL
jgi:Ca2+-binding EF-hand superfamily protein